MCFTRMLGIVVAAGALGLVPAVAGATSPGSCSAGAPVVLSARSEGVTELAGDIVLSCLGGTPTANGAPVPAVTLSVFLNTPVTSRVFAAPWSEALLLVDEPGSGLPGAPPTQLACQTASGVCALTGTAGVGPYNGSPGHPNVFQGQVSGSAITFPNVPLDAPATNATRYLRITNIRFDASAVNALSCSAGPVVTSVTFGGSPLVTASTPTVAFARSGVGFSARTAGGSAALTAPAQLAPCTTQRVALRAEEAFGTAFKKRTIATDPTVTTAQSVPGTIFSTESGFFNPLLVGHAVRGSLETAGLAASGTRVKAVFDHVPAGASVFVPTTVTTSATTLQLVAAENAPFSPVPPQAGAPAGTAQVAVSNGAGAAVWEVVGTNPAMLEMADIGVVVSSGAAGGTIRVSAGLAPAGASGPTPRFTGASPPTDLVDVGACAAAQPQSGLPMLAKVGMTNRRFRVARQATAIAAGQDVPKRARKAPLGTRFRFTLSAPAKLQIAIRRRASGLRSGRRCVAPTATLKRRHAKRCTRTLTVGTLMRARALPGARSLAFSGRIGRRALAPRRYTAVLTASNGAGRSNPVSLAFVIVR